ncbi:Presenilin-domain-containing protein [Zopfochytrium polystomum]|nr:Presenilin-domain-containing protein [Zopfochytrium polystomum]
MTNPRSPCPNSNHSTSDGHRQAGPTIELGDFSSTRSAAPNVSDDPSSATPLRSPSVTDRPICRVCSKPARFMCSICDPVNAAQYCSQPCQAQDWPEHRLVCSGLAKAATAAAQGSQDRAAGNSSSGGGGLSSESQDRLHYQSQQHSAASGGRDMDDAASIGSLRRRKVFGFRNVAQLLNRKKAHQNASSSSLRRGSGGLAPEPFDEEDVENVKFYMNQLYVILRPVLLCIVLSILWVKVTNPVSPLFDAGLSGQSPDIFVGGLTSVVAGNADNADTGDSGASVKAALIILGQVVGATIVIVLLFIFNCMKILYGIFGIIVLGLLGLFGFTLGLQLLSVSNAAFDYITFFVFLWNLDPRWLEQIYLVLMSSMMHQCDNKLAASRAAGGLGALSVWPAKNSDREFEKEQSRDPGFALLNHDLDDGHPGRHAETLPSRQRQPRQPVADAHGTQRRRKPAAARVPGVGQRVAERPRGGRGGGGGGGDGAAAAGAGAGGEGRAANDGDGDEDEEDERSGMKLGLGDFVFYSVLVSRAALFDWVTTVTCMVAVLTGLNMTIFLLVIWQKALPALPISIAFGLLFYFVASITLVPFLNAQINLPARLLVKTTDASALWVGKSGGGGFVYV